MHPALSTATSRAALLSPAATVELVVDEVSVSPSSQCVGHLKYFPHSCDNHQRPLIPINADRVNYAYLLIKIASQMYAIRQVDKSTLVLFHAQVDNGLTLCFPVTRWRWGIGVDIAVRSGESAISGPSLRAADVLLAFLSPVLAEVTTWTRFYEQPPRRYQLHVLGH